MGVWCLGLTGLGCCVLLVGLLVESDDDLLSRGVFLSIIGAALFHGPVRDGKAWCQGAMVVRLEAGVTLWNGVWVLGRGCFLGDVCVGLCGVTAIGSSRSGN